MSGGKTGRYAVVDGEFVKVSDEIPKLRSSVFLPAAGAFEPHLADKAHPFGRYVGTKAEKRRIMSELGVAEL